MATIALTGGQVLTPDELRFTNVWITDGKVERLSDLLPEHGEIFDVSGCYVTPGLIDLQVNGAEPCNLWDDPAPKQIEELCTAMLKAGVTCFLPTLITDDLTHLRKNVDLLSSLGAGKEGGSQVFGVRMPGLHLEGPCLSPQRPGVHPPQHLQPLEISVLERIVTDSVKLVTLAPELDPSGKAIEWLTARGVTVSLGHSNATFEEAGRAFDRSGVRLMTHTFNALPPLHHRSPGAVGAALLDERVTCCIICDGLHVEPHMVRLLVQNKGVQRTVLVTDIAKVGTTSGGLVGSSIYLDEAVRNIVSWGVVSFPDAIKMATVNAAAAVGLQDRFGMIEAGRDADIVVWDCRTLAINRVYHGGRLFQSA